MADVKRKHDSVARPVALSGCALALLSALVALGEEQSVPSSYYLTVKLVKSHLPEDPNVQREKLRRVFSGGHTNATLQIEFDILGKNTYHSTTVARTFDVEASSLVGRPFGRRRDNEIAHELSNYEIVSERKLYRDDKVTLGVTYSATHQSIGTMRAFLDQTGPFKVADFTYSGLASRALRMFARSSGTQHSRSTSPSAKVLQGMDCLILAPNEDKPCPTNGSDLNFPYVKLDIDVSHTRFAVDDEGGLFQDLHVYMDRNHGGRQGRLLGAIKGPQLDRGCRELRAALDVDLVPNDRNLVLLGLLKKMAFDPHAERPIACWSDQEDDLRSLIERYETLRLGDCARSNARSRIQECELVGDFMLGWRGVSRFVGGPFSWLVRYPGRDDESSGNLEKLRKQYRLELRYGNFDHKQGEWIGTGSIHDVERRCLFAAEIGISVAVNQDEDTLVVHRLRVDAKTDAELRRSDIRDSAAWSNYPECEVET